MLQKGFGWLLCLLMLTGAIFILRELRTELAHVQTLDEYIENQVSLEAIEPASNSYMYDRNGDLISEIYQEYRLYQSIEQIPELFISAFIATEDHRFFQHQGYDLSSIMRAALTNMKNQSIQEGASTITQQLTRNVFLSHEVSYDRKFQELLYAYELEKKYTKEDILELYLNTIYFHNGVYGIEAASQYYFSKDSQELSLAEVAFLTAIPNNPSIYNPLEHSDRTKARQEWILSKMLEHDFINELQFSEAEEEEIELHVKSQIDEFPDYVTYIHDELHHLIGKTEGFHNRLAQADTEHEKQQLKQELDERITALLNQGIHIETALDPILQKKAVNTVDSYLQSTDIQGSAVMIDHEANEIVAMTGGVDYQKYDFHRAFQEFRQPGSAIKPLLVYGPYIDSFGAAASSTVNANNVCFEGYCPKNYGGGEYGHVSLSTALKHSYNTPAVRLLHELTVDEAFSYFERFGFTKLSEDDYRLPAALGGLTYGISPLELTQAYTVFAHGGVRKPSYGITAVRDQDGEILYQWENEETIIWSEETNEQMRLMLHEVVSGGTARQALFSSDYIGGKTGTTNDYHDVWFVGLTEQYTTGVWLGKDQRRSIYSFASTNPHLRIWKKLMEHN